MVDGIIRLICYVFQLCLIATVSAQHGVFAGVSMIAAILANGVACGAFEKKRGH